MKCVKVEINKDVKFKLEYWNIVNKFKLLILSKENINLTSYFLISRKEK